MSEDTTQFEDNQDIQDTHAPNGWGGPRPNAGRKKHSRDKLVITDFFTTEERQLLIHELKEQIFEKHDRDMIKFATEQLFGKATQRQELTGAEGEPLVIALAESIIKKNALDTETERDSE